MHQQIEPCKPSGVTTPPRASVRYHLMLVAVWRIGDHKLVEKSIPKIAQWQKSYGKGFVEACKIRCYDAAGCCVPQSFDADILDNEFLVDLNGTREDLEIDPAITTNKLYSISDITFKAIQELGPAADFVFDVSREETKIILTDDMPTFILGRSGTGKTTCLIFKLLLKRLMAVGRSEAVPKSLFITRSEKLADQLRGHIMQLMRAHCPSRSTDIRHERAENRGTEIWEVNKLKVDLSELQGGHFPLVITFETLISMLRQLLRKFPTHPKANHSSYDSQSSDLKVSFDKFVRSYWPRCQTHLKKEVPADVCFSEILGVIKSMKGDGRHLSREEYVKRTGTLPLTTRERGALYDIYQAYEKHKSKERETDDLDDLRDLLRSIANNSKVSTMLGELFSEIYIDGKGIKAAILQMLIEP